MYVVFVMLLALLLSCTGSAGRPKPAIQSANIASDGMRGSVRTGETDLVVALNAGGEDCGPGPCLGEMRLEIEERVLTHVLSSLEASEISVGVVTTNLHDVQPPWAQTVLPISHDPSSVQPDLSKVFPNSAALLHLGALLDQATIELARLPGCASRGAQAERKRVLLFVNETPLLPYGQSFIDANLKTGGRAAERAAREKVKIFVVGFAPLEDRVEAELRQIAAITDGRYEAVSNEDELSRILAKFTAEWLQK